MINVYRYVDCTKVEGPGKRFCIWFQGCSHRCEGCYARDTWSFDENQLMRVSDVMELIDYAPGIEGVTILGGEPFDQPEALEELVKEIKLRNLSIIVFTGYTLEEIETSDNICWRNVLNNIDVLIDGLYEAANRSFDIPLIGSSNQRYYFFTDRYSMADFEDNKIEIRIGKDGILKFNGMGDFPMLLKKMGRNVDGIQ